MSYRLLENKIEELISPSVGSMGYEIVRIKFIDGGVKTLQIMAERVRDRKLDVGDCKKISRAVSAILEVEDAISDEYNLEISSPGIDRPLVKQKDFSDFAGKSIKLTTKYPIEGRKKFKGLLIGAFGDDVKIKLEDDGLEHVIPFDNIDHAKLVITDELLGINVKKKN